MSRLSRRVIVTAAALGMAAAYPGLALAASPATGATQSAPAAKTESTPMAKPMAHQAKAKAKSAESERWTAWNSRVRDVQEALNKQSDDKLVVDGKLGPKTRAAIKAFQAKNGLKATGIPDKATLAKMHVAPHTA